MGEIGFPELLLILGVVVLLFGPQKLPEIGRSLGKSIKEFKDALREGEPGSEKVKPSGSDQTNANPSKQSSVCG